VRVQLQNDTSTEQFAKQLLDIGNGKIAIDELTGCITLPTYFCTITKSKEELIQCVFSNITQNYKSHQWLIERAILAPQNVDVNIININNQNVKTASYKSVDTVMHQYGAVNYPTKFLN